jgi:hypothetical protein
MPPQPGRPRLPSSSPPADVDVAASVVSGIDVLKNLNRYTEMATQGAKKMSREFDQFRAVSSRFGSGVQGGLIATTKLASSVLTQNLTPALRISQRAIVDEIGTIKGWSDAQRLAVGSSLQFSTTLGVMSERVSRTRDSINAATGPMSSAFLMLKNSVMGWVTAGLQGTAEGYQLNYQFQQLSRQIAAVFLPVIRTAIQTIREAVDWFRGLTREQQDSFRNWTLIVGGVLGAGYALSWLAGILVSTTAAVQALNAGFLVLVARSPAVAGAAMVVGKGLSAAAAVVFNPVSMGLLAVAAAVLLISDRLEKMNAGIREAVGEMNRFNKGEFTKKEFDESEITKKARSIQDPKEREKYLKSVEEGSNANALEAKRRLEERYGGGGFQAGANRLRDITYRDDGKMLTDKAKGFVRDREIAKQLREENRTGNKFSGYVPDPKMKAGTPEASKPSDRLEVTPMGGQFSDVTNVFKRFQEAASKGDVSEDKKQTDLLAQIAMNTKPREVPKGPSGPMPQGGFGA